MNVVLVDPSLYTPAYDGALTRALLANGMRPIWATRPVRPHDRQEIPAECAQSIYYRRVDQLARLPRRLRLMLKGCAHLAGMVRLLRKVHRSKPDVVHFQWVVLPLIDLVAMALIRRWCPLVVTVHDTVPYNGQKMSWPQRVGYDACVKLAHHVIVHTRSGRQRLLRRGVLNDRLSVIAHGPLSLSVAAPPPRVRDARWTTVLFGEIKPYKGFDILIEAVGALPPHLRSQLRVVVAGRPRMDIRPLAQRIDALGVSEQFELRLKRLSEKEMATLFAEADSFVFPYREIDASGVYHLLSSLGKWVIASRVGVFAEENIADEGRGAVVPPEDARALASALQDAIEKRPRANAIPPTHSWSDIARATCALYERARAEFDIRLAARQRKVWQR